MCRWRRSSGSAKTLAGKDHVLVNVYEGAPHAFANRFRDCYDKAAAGMAHSRTIALLRGVMGPGYDLERLWDMHCYHEFATRDVDATMATMVAEPYVNHIPTMTGGVGQAELHRFYKNHFVNANPDDTALIPVSRTVGADRVVDEMIFEFTHDREIDWMLPGVAPTGKTGPHPAGRHRQLPRPEALSRAHLLGPGVGARADRRARSEGPAGRRRRDSAEDARRGQAVQHADATLGRERSDRRRRVDHAIEAGGRDRMIRPSRPMLVRKTRAATSPIQGRTP